jgi:bacillithiol system protein YtxJ
MHWKTIHTDKELEEAITESYEKPVLLFKHSTRCAISSMAFDRLDRNWEDGEMKETIGYMIDVIGDRGISDSVQHRFGIRHESPQLLLLRDGKVIFHDSHMGIAYDSLRRALL